MENIIIWADYEIHNFIYMFQFRCQHIVIFPFCMFCIDLLLDTVLLNPLQSVKRNYHHSLLHSIDPN